MFGFAIKPSAVLHPMTTQDADRHLLNCSKPPEAPELEAPDGYAKDVDSGVLGLVMLARFYGIAADPTSWRMCSATRASPSA